VLTYPPDNKDASSQAPRSTAQPQSSNQPTRTQSGDNKDEASQTEKPSGSQKASGSQITGKPRNTSFDPRLPAGGITMVTPNVFAGDQFYKVGNYITFAWNYTSLSVTPSAIDILASCSANQATYTIAVNQSAQETKVVWDTKNVPSGQAPFLTEKYTLLIYDAESSVTAAPRAGYLGVFNQFTFGMYTPQPYVNWSSKLPHIPTCLKSANIPQCTNAQTASKTAPLQTPRNSRSKSCSSPPAQLLRPCSTSPTTSASSRYLRDHYFTFCILFIFSHSLCRFEKKKKKKAPGASNRRIYILFFWDLVAFFRIWDGRSQSAFAIYNNLRRKG